MMFAERDTWHSQSIDLFYKLKIGRPGLSHEPDSQSHRLKTCKHAKSMLSIALWRLARPANLTETSQEQINQFEPDAHSR